MQNKLHPLTVEIINNMISEKKHKGLDDAVMTKISDRIMDQGQKPYFLIKDALIYMELEDYDRAKLCIDAAFIFRGLTFSDNKKTKKMMQIVFTGSVLWQVITTPF